MTKLFDEIPRLEGERVVLRRLEHADGEDLRELARSRRVYRYLPTSCTSRSSRTPAGSWTGCTGSASGRRNR